MATFERYAPGQFSWVDLMAHDAAAAETFYGSLFGWAASHDADDAGGQYTMFRLGEATVAGMGVMSDEMKRAGVPPYWNNYVTVENADASAARAQELGAQLLMPVIDIEVDAELVGRMTIFTDPGGANLSIWQAGSHPGSGLANQPGSFCWNELCTREVEASAKFYESLFGWQLLPGESENGYREIRLGDRSNGGILPWQPEMGEMPSSWTPYFTVEDCDAGVGQVQALGGELLVGPVAIDPGTFAVVRDDQGAVFNIMHLTHPDD